METETIESESKAYMLHQYKKRNSKIGDNSITFGYRCPIVDYISSDQTAP